MKIALFIFPFGPSHGNILQTFALKTTLEQAGCQVDIIQRLRPKPSLFYCIWRGLYYLKRYLFNDIFTTFFYGGLYPPKVERPFKDFVKKRMGHQLINVSNQKGLIAIGKGDYDAFVVGSDQSWRQEFVPRIENFFFDFIDDSKKPIRISYAASFGKDTWTYSDDQTANCRGLAQLFSSISVREKSGVELCAKHLNVSAVQVLDPTLLQERTFYDSLLDYNIGIPANACCHYILDLTEEKKMIIDKACRILNLKSFGVNKRTEDESAPIRDRIPYTINQWLAGFCKAKFVVVDSFHALVFSLVFNKEFVVIGNRQRGLERFKSLLDIVGLQERLIFSDADLTTELVNKKIDWDIVNQQLDYERKKSKTFLLGALKIKKRE